MKPRVKNVLTLWMVVIGLICTHGCGSSSSSSPAASTSNGGSTGGVTITNEVTSPAEMNVGDIMMIQFTSDSPGEFDFTGVASSSKYYLAVGAISSGYASYSVRMGNIAASDNLAKAITEEGDEWDENWTTQDAFEQRLHDIGLALALDPDAEIAGASGGEAGIVVKEALSPKAVSVGDTESFRVLNSLTSSTSYATVTGKARCVSDNVIIYVDTELDSTNPSDLLDADIQALCTNFNTQVATEATLFGTPSDINGDGKVAALLTPQVNRLGAIGGGIITGFFYAADLYARTSSNPVSNGREIVYTLVPDSAGVYGTVIPKAFGIDNLLTAVLPHELQHAISYNMHVFQGEGYPEENWLNEGLSHLSEDLVGFGQENNSRAAIYLADPSYYRIVTSGSAGLGERGGSFLFMRFLYEQHPSPVSFLNALYTSRTNGVDNLETAYAGTSEDFDQFGEFFMRWMAALAMTNRGVSTDSRYVYDTRTYNVGTSRWQGVCLVCETDDGRGTVLTGPETSTYSGSATFSVNSSSAGYYDLPTYPSSITFTGSSGGTFGAVLIRRE